MGGLTPSLGWASARPRHDVSAARDNGFRHRRSVFQSAVGTHGVEATPPRLDLHLGLSQAEEGLIVQKFIPKLGVEALAVAVLPGAVRLDIGGLRADGGDPFTQRRGNELRSVVGANIGWRPAQDHQVRQGLQHIGGVEPALDPDRQSPPRELVDHAEHAELPAVLGAVLDEVVGPDMVGPLGAQPHARPVVEPKARRRSSP